MPTNLLVRPERLERIEEYLKTQPRVTVAQLARSLRVSPVTIRGDLTMLERRGRLVRVHGGALAANKAEHELDFEYRSEMQRRAKQRIGTRAATLVADGDSIFLDASTTAFELAKQLRERRELTVITNSLRSAQYLAAAPSITVIMPGGIVRREAFSLVGMWSGDLLRQFNIRRAFMGAKGFTLEQGLTDVHPDEVALKRAITNIAREVIGLIDHTKWDHVALGSFCAIENLSTLITDRAAPRKLVDAARARGIRVVLV